MNMESDEVGACSSTSGISDNFNVAGTSQLVERQWISPSDPDPAKLLLKRSIPPQKIRKRRKPVRVVHKAQTSTYKIGPPYHTLKLPTIHEGEVYFRSPRHFSDRERRMRINSEPCPSRSMTTKGKAYNEKVAAFKSLMSRVTKMADTKPEMLQDTLSDETIKLFKSIHIK